MSKADFDRAYATRHVGPKQRNHPCPCGATNGEGHPIKFKKCCGSGPVQAGAKAYFKEQQALQRAAALKEHAEKMANDPDYAEAYMKAVRRRNRALLGVSGMPMLSGRSSRY